MRSYTTKAYPDYNSISATQFFIGRGVEWHRWGRLPLNSGIDIQHRVMRFCRMKLPKQCNPQPSQGPSQGSGFMSSTWARHHRNIEWLTVHTSDQKRPGCAKQFSALPSLTWWDTNLIQQWFDIPRRVLSEHLKGRSIAVPSYFTLVSAYSCHLLV